MHVEESRDRARAQQRRVAGQDQDVAVARAQFVVDRRQRHRDRVAGAELLALFDEDQVDVGAGALGERLLDPRRPVTDDHDRRAHVLLGGGVEDVEHHRSSAEVVQRLGTGRLHPRSLARGEDDDTGWTTHATIFIRFTPTIPTMSDFHVRRVLIFPREPRANGTSTTSMPNVRRFFVTVDGLRQLSGLRWGDGDPESMLLHGGAQNAHTYDTVALALSDHSLIALDLPGHGHSDPSIYPANRRSRVTPSTSRAHSNNSSRRPRPLVGMSLGGLTALLVAHDRPDLVSALVLIDITPGVNADKARHITDFVNGPTSFDDFDTLLARTMEHNPTRSESSLRRGILHNAVQRARRLVGVATPAARQVRTRRRPTPATSGRSSSELTMPVTLIRAMGPGSVVDDDDEAEFVRRLPHATIVHVADSGHSVQGDQPLVLAALLEHTR